MLLGLLGSWWVGGKLVAPVPKAIGPPPADLQAVSITLVTEVGDRVAAWYAAGEAVTIILLHPIRGSRLTMLPRAQFLRAAGYGVLLLDLPAHGESTGEAITLGMREQHAVSAAVQHVRQHNRASAVIVLGISLGGASALMSNATFDALILESVFPDVRSAVSNRVEHRLGPLSDLPTWLLLAQLEPRIDVHPDELRPIDHIADLTCPLFVLSGTLDPHTPSEETQAMYEAASQPKQLWLVDGAAHEDLHAYDSPGYEQRILEFLERL